MGGDECSVGACRMNSRKAKMEGLKLKYFIFPTDPKMRRRWIERCYREDGWDPTNKKICSKHFSLDNYEDELEAKLLNILPKKLKKTAVPSLYLRSKDAKSNKSRKERKMNVIKRKRTVNALLQTNYDTFADNYHSMKQSKIFHTQKHCFDRHIKVKSNRNKTDHTYVIPDYNDDNDLLNTKQKAMQNNTLDNSIFDQNVQLEIEESDDDFVSYEDFETLIEDETLFYDDNTTMKLSQLITNKEKDDITADGDQLHAEYKCDLCSGPINGFRYRCVQCVDYELCAACEARGAHERHYVLRIPGPRPYSEIQIVLERIRKELSNINNSVLLEDSQLLDSIKQQIEYELEENSLFDHQATEKCDDEQSSTPNYSDGNSDRDKSESDTNVEECVTEEHKQANDERSHSANTIHGISDNNNTRVTSESALKESKQHIDNLKRNSSSKTPIRGVGSIQRKIDPGKMRIIQTTRKRLSEYFPTKAGCRTLIFKSALRSVPNILRKSSLPKTLLIRPPPNMNFSTSSHHLLAEQLLGHKIPQVQLKPLTTEEIVSAQYDVSDQRKTEFGKKT